MVFETFWDVYYRNLCFKPTVPCNNYDLANYISSLLVLQQTANASLFAFPWIINEIPQKKDNTFKTNFMYVYPLPHTKVDLGLMRYLSIVDIFFQQSSPVDFFVRWGRSSVSINNSLNVDIVVKSFLSVFVRAALPGRTLTAIVYPASNAALASVKKTIKTRTLTNTLGVAN